MSRKEASFTQLYDYITRENDALFNYQYNFLGLGREAILNEFQKNSNLLPKRKNGNYLYHEIISISRAKNLRETQQKQILFDVIQQYTKTRAKGCLVFGGIHDEKDHHLHFHLMISANKIGDKKRFFLRKTQFDDIKKGLELYVLGKYPQLEQKKLISKKHNKQSLNNKEQAIKRRTGKRTQKERIRDKVMVCLQKSSSQSDFEKWLQKENFEYYHRSEKTMGVINLETGKKYRIKTLGIEEEFKQWKGKIKNNKIKGSIKDGLETFAKEWIMGDFTERDKIIKNEKYRKQNEADKKVKSFKDQNFQEKTAEVFDEWVLGDFSKAEARKRNEENKKRLEAWRKRNKEAKKLEKENKKGKSKK